MKRGARLSSTPRLLCLLEHPTQYDLGLWREISRRGNIGLRVAYLRNDAPKDLEIDQVVTWGRDTRDISTTEISLSQIGKTIDDTNPSAILCAGWTRPITRHTFFAARRRSLPLILPSDKILPASPVDRTQRLTSSLSHSLKNRRFQAFFTTGILGSQALRSTGVPAERIITGLYPVDIGQWQAGLRAQESEAVALRQQISSGEDNPFIVLAVVKLSARENPAMLLRGLTYLPEHARSVRLIIVGDGPLRAALRAQIQTLGLDRRVTLSGYIPYPKLPTYYGAADAFIHLPSREPWGISVLEAMACDLPVIASTTVGSAADLVVPGRSGALVSPNDPDGFAQALLDVRALCATPSYLDTIRSILTPFDVVSVAARLEKLVRHLRREKESSGWSPLTQVAKEAIRNQWNIPA